MNISSVLFVGFVLYLLFKLANVNYELKKKNILIDKNQEVYKKTIEEERSKHESELSLQKRINEGLCKLIKTKTPFKDVASLKADFETSIFEKNEHYLRYKPHPAVSSAEKLKEMREILERNLFECKQVMYKYDFLLNVFPELKKYVDDEECLVHLKSFHNYSNFDDQRDRVLDWISKYDYDRMSIVDRNELAFEKYKKRVKTNWEIGAEYEHYIGYLLRTGELIKGHKFKVDQFGVRERIHDLGRDIIAEETDSLGQKNVYIIQCKMWSKEKVLHENVVCQLYGTTLEYMISNGASNMKVIPMLVTTTELSSVANKFASVLNVTVVVKSLGDYPMIKCNVDSKIYHLPFDQQYNVTQIIEEKGEFFAWNVHEAEEKGYRRAMRYFG